MLPDQSDRASLSLVDLKGLAARQHLIVIADTHTLTQTHTHTHTDATGFVGKPDDFFIFIFST